MIVREIIDKYLRHAEAVNLYCPEALAQRRQTLGLFAEAQGALPIDDCRPFHLTDWIEEHDRWKSSSTKKARANQVNACFNWAAGGGRIAQNPFRSVNYPEADPRPCLPDDTLHMIENLANKAFERACRFLRLTGCRLSDLCRMNWADVDLVRGVVILARHKSRKRTKKPKVIALTTAAAELLVEVRSLHPKAGGEDPVFTNNRGTCWTRRTLGQQLRRIKDRYGIATAATLHGIRHQFGTEAVRRGASLKMVSLQLGHSSVLVTEKYYLHLDKDIEAIRAAAEEAAPRTG